MLQRVFRALTYRDFRLMWLGACTSTIGTFVQQFAQSWLVYKLSGDPFYLGLDLFLGQTPVILFSLIGGVLADRMDRRKMLLISQYIQMTCAFTLTALFFLNLVHIWHILVLSFLVGCGQSLGGPAYSALLPSLVNLEDVQNAIAMNSIQFNLARIIGPTIGGLAFTRLGATWCFLLNGVSFIAVIISLYMIHVNYVPAKTREPILTSMKEGIRFIRHREGMEPMVAFAFLMTLLGFSLTAFLPVFVTDVFKQGPETYQLLLVCSGAGAVCGGLMVAWMGKLKHQGRTALFISGILGALIAGFALSHKLQASCVIIFCSGAAMMASAGLLLSAVQFVVGDAMRGRVMSVYNVAFRAGMPMGSLVVGKMIPVFGVSRTIACTGSLLTLLVFYFLSFHRRIATL